MPIYRATGSYGFGNRGGGRGGGRQRLPDPDELRRFRRAESESYQRGLGFVAFENGRATALGVTPEALDFNERMRAMNRADRTLDINEAQGLRETATKRREIDLRGELGRGKLGVSRGLLGVKERRLGLDTRRFEREGEAAAGILEREKQRFELDQWKAWDAGATARGRLAVDLELGAGRQSLGERQIKARRQEAFIGTVRELMAGKIDPLTGRTLEGSGMGYEEAIKRAKELFAGISEDSFGEQQAGASQSSYNFLEEKLRHRAQKRRDDAQTTLNTIRAQTGNRY